MEQNNCDRKKISSGIGGGDVGCSGGCGGGSDCCGCGYGGGGDGSGAGCGGTFLKNS